MKVKTSELTGAALDWAVSTIEYPNDSTIKRGDAEMFIDCNAFGDYSFSTDWAKGGPIIEREGIWLRGPHDATKPDGDVVVRIDYWYAHCNHKHVKNGPTPLIAAMRCYVASKLSDEIDVPEELQ